MMGEPGTQSRAHEGAPVEFVGFVDRVPFGAVCTRNRG